MFFCTVILGIQFYHTICLRVSRCHKNDNAVVVAISRDGYEPRTLEGRQTTAEQPRVTFSLL